MFRALLPGGAETKLRILSIDGTALLASCGVPEQGFLNNAASPSNLPPIYLFQALPKAAKMDLIVRQAAEGGILEIFPFESEFSIAKRNPRPKAKTGAAAEKILRWERIIREARQQSGSPVPTRVKTPGTLDEILDYWARLKKDQTQGAGILLHQEPLETAADQNSAAEKRTAPLAKGSFHDYLSDNPDFVVLAVGPEGGFSSGEAARFLNAGFRPLVMGDTVLRTETAALYGAAAVRIILKERLAWELKPAKPLSRSG